MGMPVLLRNCLPLDAALFPVFSLRHALPWRGGSGPAYRKPQRSWGSQADAGPHEGPEARAAAGFGATGPRSLMSGPAGPFAPEGWYLEG